jgi:osmotically-inducible protein OsmY
MGSGSESCARGVSSASSAAPISCGRSPLFRETKTTVTNDAEIRERVIAELGKHRWTSLGLFDVMVHNGIVELWGSVTDDCARQAMGVAAENVPGVKEVRNRLVWVEPVSAMPVLPEDTAPPQAS